MIIEVDEYKKKVAGYDATKSEEFHLESAKLADKEFTDSLKSKKYKRIIFMAGGTASGKTEFASSYFIHKDQLVYDGTLKSFDGFKIKLERIERYDKNKSKIKVVLIIPYEWTRAYDAFKTRERKMKDLVFFDTQVRSRMCVARILRETKIRVEVYFSVFDEKREKLFFKRVSGLSSRNQMAVILEKLSGDLRSVAQKNGFDIQ
jgi:adenosyl cobinamide kinase/adenosyl cobinamide phosphate guanylyltransferase